MIDQAVPRAERSFEFANGSGVDLAAAGLAFALHLAIVLVAPRGVASATERAVPEPVHVFDLAPIEEPQVVPEVPEPEAPVEPARVTRTVERSPRAEAPAPAEPSVPSTSEAPLDLSSMVVGGAEGMDFGRVGGGGSASGVRAAPTTPTPQPVVEAGPRVARGPEDLSTDVRPPPGLDGLLESFYPSNARAQGLAGSARVRLRFDVEGRVVAATLVSETPTGSGFGSACRRMLLEGPRWTPALDPEGSPIARAGRDFRCRFELR